MKNGWEKKQIEQVEKRKLSLQPRNKSFGLKRKQGESNSKRALGLHNIKIYSKAKVITTIWFFKGNEN